MPWHSVEMPGTVERYGKGRRHRARIGIDSGTRKRRCVTKGGFDTEKEATKAMHRVLGAAGDGMVVKRPSLRFGAYFDGRTKLASPNLKPTIAGGCARALLKISEKLGRSGSRTWRRSRSRRCTSIWWLSPKTVRNTYSMLRLAVANAVRLGLVLRTAAAAPRPPSVQHSEQPTCGAAALNTFLAGLHNHRLLASVVLLAATGLRRGGMPGLRWTGVELPLGSCR